MAVLKMRLWRKIEVGGFRFRHELIESPAERVKRRLFRTAVKITAFAKEPASIVA